MKKISKKVLCSLIATSFLLVGCNSEDADSEDADSDDTDSANTLIVATFNTGDGDPAEQRKLLAENNVEIFGLQEIDFDNIRSIDEGVDLLNPMPEYAQEPYTDFYFGEAMRFSGGGYGNAIVANTELKDTSSTKLYIGDPSAEASKLYDEILFAYDPRDQATVDAFQAVGKEGINGEKVYEPRAFSRAVIEKNGEDVAFYSAHLSWEDFDVRQKQMDDLIQAMKDDPIEYQILVGDFNIYATSEVYKFQDDFTLGNGGDGIWRDTFIEEDDSMNVYSIDNIIVSKNIEVKDIKALDTDLSDHRPLIATLELN